MIDFLLILIILCLIIFSCFLFRINKSQQDLRQLLLKNEAAHAMQFRQFQGLMNIYFVTKPSNVLPAFRDLWSISPDFAEILMQEVINRKPKLIIDIGSGASSIVMGYCLKKIGAGKILALDHDQKFADRTSNYVRAHGLEEYVEVLHQPLVQADIDSFQGVWYDSSFLNKIQQKIDFVIVDAPPGYIQKYSRYPALPFLYDYLSDRAAILVDDTKREDESVIVSRWKEKYKEFNSTSYDTETGAVLLARSNK
uniref:Class I SAM-dependent methyltransferase n=1 Tax=Roseihalotalea indica TaxID=2867963 RepID=A0AA49GP49_9BACT|nr:class I SAM-dependent methyltransferase [Tunicatimonas sp. TK19036]